MPISVNPILPVIAGQGAARDVVLQPGTVVDAQVLKLLSENLVRIAISSLSIDVLSEVPLQVGQSVQLAVSQTPDGIRLAVVGPDSGAPAVTLIDTVPVTPGALAGAAAGPAMGAAAPRIQLTPVERLALSVAAQSAATQQDSLAPLFANLGAVAASNALPTKLQQAVMEVLAQRTTLDENLTGNDIKHAVQKSGLFLEASLALESVRPAPGVPDLKAALIVLRQTLLSSLGKIGAAETPIASTAAAQLSAVQGIPTLRSADAASGPHATAILTLAPSASPDIDLQQVPPPQARLPLAADALESNAAVRIVLPETLLDIEPHIMTAGPPIKLLQEVLHESSDVVGKPSLLEALPKGGRNDEVIFRTNTPPPPFRGAQPSAQPVASPSLAPHAPLKAMAHHLLADTDAALARQTLLQVASLPDRVDTASTRLDPAVPRWSFEIPFATAQGTAMAQFEISRDGGGIEAEAAKSVWRARFSLDVEPAGPVHALVSLSGERTSVRMWAERPATAAQLRAGAAQLSQALSHAELQPGDIVIREGTPPQAAPAPAGHFLDRAL
jgi:hypothetical protein